MPLADLTAVANLALDHLGEPYLTDYETDTGTTADAVRVHLPVAIQTALEAHDWQFATRTATLATATGSPPTVVGWLTPFNLPAECNRVLRVTSGTGTAPNDFFIQATWLFLAPSGASAPTIEYIWSEVPPDRWPSLFVDCVAFLLASRIAPKLTNNAGLADSFLGKYASSLAQARGKDAIDLHRKQNLGEVENMALDLLGRAFLTDEDLNRGMTYDTLRLHKAQVVGSLLDAFPWTWATRFATLSAGSGTLPGWLSKWTLPSGFQKALRVERSDGLGLPNDYHIQGGSLYLPESGAAAPVLHYISSSTAESDWSPAFKEAAVHLLASRIAPKLTTDPNLSTALLQKAELALQKAKAQNAIELHKKTNVGEIGNLALDMVGRSYLNAEDIDAGMTYDTVNAHKAQCVKTLLEGHVWSFATRCAQVNAVPVSSPIATLTTGIVEQDNALVFTAVPGGPAGNEISVEIVAEDIAVSEVRVSGKALTVAIANKAQMVLSGASTPGVNGTLLYVGSYNGINYWNRTGTAGDNTATILFYYLDEIDSANNRWSIYHPATVYIYDAAPSTAEWPDGVNYTAGPQTVTVTASADPMTAADVIALVAANPSAAALVTVTNATGSDGTGLVAVTAKAYLSGGATVATVYAPAYASAFNLPDDCLRLIKIDGEDIDIPRKNFEIHGRYLLIEEELAEAPVIHYIMAEPPESEWPSTFKEAVIALLASKLAAKLAPDPNLSLSLAARAEVALGRARSKDTRETRSNENMGPRQLAARSGLVNARYRNSRPPY